MNYIQTPDYHKGSVDLSERIASEINKGKKVFWFLTGGSTIPAFVETLDLLKEKNSNVKNITVTLTDERYGEVGHKDSSWQKLIESGFDFSLVNAIPVIAGKSFEETAKDWESEVRRVLEENNFIVSQFGIGSDLHIAGILPESPATKETGLVAHYHFEAFDRITLTFEAIKKIQAAYVFIFGESKKDVVSELKTSEADLSLKPANVLKSIPEVFIYSDNT